jgi:hypothetical protein
VIIALNKLNALLFLPILTSVIVVTMIEPQTQVFVILSNSQLQEKVIHIAMIHQISAYLKSQCIDNKWVDAVLKD